jgi:hypothetical protein
MSSWMYGFFENEKGELQIGEIYTQGKEDKSDYLPPLFVNPITFTEWIGFDEAEKVQLIEDLQGALEHDLVITQEQLNAVMANWTPKELDPKDFVTFDEVFKTMQKEDKNDTSKRA